MVVQAKICVLTVEKQKKVGRGLGKDKLNRENCIAS